MSPVIATILMVAVTVVLAATVYIWVSGFGTSQPTSVSASFAAKSIDLPTGFAGADNDTAEDTIEIVFVQAGKDFAVSDVVLAVDGTTLTSGATGYSGATWIIEQASLGDGTWNRGDSILIHKAAGAAMKGNHLVRVTVGSQVILDTSTQVYDDL